jgi:chemotaxis protein histidine kinase CheA
VGLYITREIVERHGGRIVLESPAGGGARFVITLPASTPAPSGAIVASPIAHAPDGSPVASRVAAG